MTETVVVVGPSGVGVRLGAERRLEAGRRWYRKVVAGEPSPQSTVTAQGLSGPGSVNEPRLKDVGRALVRALGAPPAVTVGATLATCTICDRSESVSEAPSESVTLIATLVVPGRPGRCTRSCRP